jgi:uncharacterized protein (DUF2236 family)
VTWKVWGYPTSMIVGFLRAVVIEELDPFLVASVEHSGQVKQRTRLRYDRTMQYFATVMFGDAQSVLAAAETLVKIHGRAVGTEPITGRTYDANDPDSQLWIHLTAWHSILYTYEVFGPGRLPAAEEERYWEQCAVAAYFRTIDPVIATIPQWMGKLAGTPQSRATDIAATVQMRLAMRTLAASPALQLAVLRRLSPLTAPIVEPILLGLPPEQEITWTPEQAYAHFGTIPPARQYAELLAGRTSGTGPRAYDRHHHDPAVDFPVVDQEG